MITGEIPSGGHSRDQLVAAIREVLDIRQQVRDLNAFKAERKKEFKAAGFDSRKIEEVCMWLEKVEKHGREAMDEAEAIYDLYRQVVDGEGKAIGAMMDDARDRALLKIFAPDDQVDAKLTASAKKMRTSLALAQGAAMGRRL